MCCIIETLVRKDRSGKWSEHGRRAHVIYNLETLETKEPKTGFFEPQQRYTWFQQRNSDQRTFLRTTKPRIVPPHHKYRARTNAVSTKGIPT